MTDPTHSHNYHEPPNPHTVIDLTNDIDEVMPQRRISRILDESQGPQILGLNSAAGMEEVVDLTVDREQDEGDEIIVTGQRRVVLRRSISRPGPRSTFNSSSRNTLRSNSPSLFLPSNPSMPVLPPGYRFTAVRDGDGRLAVDLTRFGQIFPPIENIPTILQLSSLQPMARRREFAHPTYSRTPPYVPPPAPRDNFTRSPTSTDIIVCPSCDEELVHNKGDPIFKKPSKTTSKKDRAEHPFWVIKECGHVYCNKCFQNRADKSKSTAFREIMKPSGTKSSAKKTLTCAVEDCKCEIRSKEKWVGVFL